MDTAKQIAELLSNFFVLYCSPERHREWRFLHGSDEEIIVTIEIVKKPKPYEQIVSMAEWIVPENMEVSLS